MSDTLDLENRDPNGLNAKLGVQFEDVLGEPDGAHSIDCVWQNSYKCYNCGIGCCYKLLTCLCGICIALYWGMTFACIAFENIWCITPGCKVYDLNCSMVRKFIESVLGAILGPCCTTCGLCLSKIEVVQKSG